MCGKTNNSDIPIPSENGIYNVPMDTWTVSGHMPKVITAKHSTHGSFISSGGLGKGAILHQGSIGIGRIDLSRYSKIIVYYGFDNSQITQERFANNPHNRILVLNEEMTNSMSPDKSAVIASAPYTIGKLGTHPQEIDPYMVGELWAIRPLVIDIADIDYNGSVYITYDTLPGTFMLIAAIQLIEHGYEEEADNSSSASKGLQFTSYGDGTCYMSGIGTCSDTDIIIPNVSPEGDRVVRIGNLAFHRCENITSITVPEGVSSIGYRAFIDCYNLKELYLPDSVISIQLDAVANCYKLESVKIPRNITGIDAWAFWQCTNLNNVYYAGSKAEWSAIWFGKGNECLTSATIHFNYKP